MQSHNLSALDIPVEVTGNSKVRGIIGGMHYTDYSDLDFIVPSHCTTVRGNIALKKRLGEKVFLSETYSFGVGNSITIGDALKLDFVA